MINFILFSIIAFVVIFTVIEKVEDYTFEKDRNKKSKTVTKTHNVQNSVKLTPGVLSGPYMSATFGNGKVFLGDSKFEAANYEIGVDSDDYQCAFVTTSRNKFIGKYCYTTGLVTLSNTGEYEESRAMAIEAAEKLNVKPVRIPYPKDNYGTDVAVVRSGNIYGINGYGDCLANYSGDEDGAAAGFIAMCFFASCGKLRSYYSDYSKSI